VDTGQKALAKERMRERRIYPDQHLKPLHLLTVA
jgi:hypothetical protein